MPAKVRGTGTPKKSSGKSSLKGRKAAAEAAADTDDQAPEPAVIAIAAGAQGSATPGSTVRVFISLANMLGFPFRLRFESALRLRFSFLSPGGATTTSQLTDQVGAATIVIPNQGHLSFSQEFVIPQNARPDDVFLVTAEFATSGVRIAAATAVRVELG